MKRLIVVAATLLIFTTVSAVTATASRASVCQSNGTGCTIAGTYSVNAVINSDYGGVFRVVWTKSVVQPYSSGVPLYWTAYVTYTNISSSNQILNCSGADVSGIAEHMSGGSGDDGTVYADSTQCSQDPSFSVTVPPSHTATDFATFHNVPWPGSTVALTWGNNGTSPYVYPFGCRSTAYSNWAGYAVCGSYFTSVQAQWTVPAAHGGGNKGSAFWVGLGGIFGSLEQIGTSSDVVNGKAVYEAWLEFVPGGTCGTLFYQVNCSSPPVFLSKTKYPVHAGDVITAMVSVTHGDQYEFALADYSANSRWNFSVEETNSGGDNSSAEVITEDSDGRHPGIPMTNFGSVTFSHIAVNNSVLADYDQTKYTLTSGDVEVSGLSNNTTVFQVTYVHS